MLRQALSLQDEFAAQDEFASQDEIAESLSCKTASSSTDPQRPTPGLRARVRTVPLQSI